MLPLQSDLDVSKLPVPEVKSPEEQMEKADLSSQEVSQPHLGLQAELLIAPEVYVPPPCPNRVPTIAGITHFDPITVHNLLAENKCLLVDLRGDDRASGLIEGAVHEQAISTVPFKCRVPDLCRRWAHNPIVIFTCQYSAHRAPQCANWYREKAHPRQRVGILSGGFRGWESVGLPVVAQAIGDAARDRKSVV